MVIKNFLIHEGHQNRIIGSKVTAILLKGGFCLLVELHWGGSVPAACAPTQASLDIVAKLSNIYHLFGALFSTSLSVPIDWQ